MGDRGLVSIEHMQSRSIIRLARYVHLHRDSTALLAAVHFHQATLANSKSLLHRADILLHDLDLTLDAATKPAVKFAIASHSRGTLLRRPLQGRFWHRLSSANIDQALSLSWLQSPGLRPETEGFVIAAQEQVLGTRNFQAHISRVIPVQEDVCRKCGAVGETIDHLLNCCPVLAKHAYIARHDHLVHLLHWAICAQHGVPSSCRPAHHQLVHTVKLPGGGSLLWEVSLPTDIQLSANRPDLVLRTPDHTFLIDVAVPLEQNLSTKAEEKIAKYRPLCYELQRLWELPKLPEVVPVVFGVPGWCALGHRTQFAADLRQEVCVSTLCNNRQS